MTSKRSKKANALKLYSLQYYLVDLVRAILGLGQPLTLLDEGDDLAGRQINRNTIVNVLVR